MRPAKGTSPAPGGAGGPNAQGAANSPAGWRKYDDIGNAERLADLAEGEILWASGLGWLVWDGKRWKRDEANQVLAVAKRAARSVFGEAGRLNDQAHKASDDGEARHWANQAANATTLGRPRAGSPVGSRR